MKEIKDEQFEAAVAGAKYACVDMNAKWCGPCKSLAPRLEKLAGEHGDVTFLSADVEECVDASEKYRIMSVPTLLFFKDGVMRPELKIVGAVGEDKIRETLSKLVNAD